MPLLLLTENPLYFLAWISAILVALTIHEFSHAYIAYKLGDNTPKSMGRLTLNPLAHIDWFGLLMLILIGFGWGNPVVFNPYNLKYKKWGPALVAMAGPVSNLVQIAGFGLILKLLEIFTRLSISNLLVQFIDLLIIINAVLLIFNLIPIPPLDGSKLLFAILDKPKYANFKMKLESRGPMILIILILADNIFRIGIFSAIFSGVINLIYRLF